jgi:predicted O-methyltransferase YrrM
MIKHVAPDYPIIEPKNFGRRPTTKFDISGLLYLIRLSCKKNILEIGTWYGKTTYEIASNFPEKTIFTMDYMEDDLVLSEHETKHRASKEDLCKYANEEALNNVCFIYANSHIYNFDKFKKSGTIIDFIFIDGDHSFDGVKIDTEKSIDYLKKNGGGTIAWHDIHTKNLTQVPDYMQYLSKSIDIYYLKDTNIGYMPVEGI